MANVISRISPLRLDSAMSGPVDMTQILPTNAINSRGEVLVNSVYVPVIRWIGPTTSGHKWIIVDGAGNVLAQAQAGAGDVGGTPEYRFDAIGGLTLSRSRGWFVSQIDSGELDIYFSTGSTAGRAQSVDDVAIHLSNVPTNNVSTLHHGFAPILPNDGTKFLDGTGAYSYTPLRPAITFLNPTQMNNVKGTPVQLVPAPANGYMNRSLDIALSYHGVGNTPYTVSAGGDLVILWGTNNFATSKSPTLNKSILNQAADQIGFFTAYAIEGNYDDHNNTESLPLMLSQLGAGEYSAGTAPVQVIVNYLVVPIF